MASAAVAGTGVLLVVFAVWYLGGWGGETLRAYVTDGLYPPIALLFTVLAVRVVRHDGLDAHARRAWRLIAASLACQLVAHTSWFIEDTILHATGYPSFADYWFLAFVPFMFAGLLMLPGRRRTRTDRVKLALDSLIVGAGTFMVLWYLVLGPIVVDDEANLSEIIYSAALPVGDLLLVLALTTVLMGRGVADAPVRLLAGAVGAYVVADVYYGYIQLHQGFVGGTWPDVFWLTGCYLFALAAHRQRRQVEQVGRGEQTRRTRVNWIPYSAITLAYGLLCAIARKEAMYPLGGMIIGAVLLTALVVARQMYSLRENRDLAVSDPLTHLANRTLVTERLTQLTSQPLRKDRLVAVMIIDLDRFKPINDTFGHEAGDAVLKAVAVVLCSVIRAGDTAGRLGGDEFAVILQNLTSEVALGRVAERLVETLRTPVIFGEHLLAVEASVGVAVRTGSTADAEQLIQQADIAMYAAKRAGRGRHVFYDPSLDVRSRDVELRAAIDNGELVVYFQPVVDLNTGAPAAVEALVRWNHPTRGLLMPGEFIGLAEETGAVIPLGEWVLREACRQAAEWRATMPATDQLRLSVNMSPRQVVRHDLVDTIRRVLADTGFPADRLVLELTESVVLEPDPHVVGRLEDLRDLGITIAVDDFGTGYSALSYLRRLPVTLLKIDRSFVTGIAEDPEARAVAEAVVRLGMAFHMHVVAEGIETAEQARVLVELGCGYGQGYYFYRPMDGEAATEVIKNYAPNDVAGWR